MGGFLHVIGLGEFLTEAGERDVPPGYDVGNSDRLAFSGEKLIGPFLQQSARAFRGVGRAEHWLAYAQDGLLAQDGSNLVAPALAAGVAAGLLSVHRSADDAVFGLGVPPIHLDPRDLPSNVAVGPEAQESLAPFQRDHTGALVLRRPEMQRRPGDISLVAVARRELVDELESSLLILLDLMQILLGRNDVGVEMVRPGDLLDDVAVASLSPALAALAGHHGKGIVVPGDCELGRAILVEVRGDLRDDARNQRAQGLGIAVAHGDFDGRPESEELDQIAIAVPGEKFARVEVECIDNGEAEAAGGIQFEVDLGLGDCHDVIAQQVLAGDAHGAGGDVEIPLLPRERCEVHLLHPPEEGSATCPAQRAMGRRYRWQRRSFATAPDPGIRATPTRTGCQTRRARGVWSCRPTRAAGLATARRG